MLAVPTANAESISRLHHEGWLEAQGELLSATEFPALFETIGRAWTSDTAPNGWFAVPDVPYRPRKISSDNPYGVLGPGDLIFSRPPAKRWANSIPLSYWIYVGRDLRGTHPEKVQISSNSHLAPQPARQP